MCYTVLLVRPSDVVGCILHLAGGIGHSYAQTSKANHAQVVITISYGDEFLASDAKILYQATETCGIH